MTHAVPTQEATVSGPTPGSLRAWLSAARPKTLPATLAPIGLAVGMAAHAGAFDLLLSLACLLTTLFLQLASNFANDYFDHQKGADGADRLGPDRACQTGALSPRHVAVATVLMVLLATLTGGYIVMHADWVLATLGVFAVVAAVAYTGGPYPLGYHGLGDIVVFIFFGPVAVLGTYWLQAREISAAAAVASVAMGTLITAILVVNNLRDRESDARVGKRTLAVRLGARATRIQYGALLSVGLLLPAGASLMGYAAPGWIWSLALLPVGAWLIRQLTVLDGRALNPLLGKTAVLALLMAAVLVATGAPAVALGVAAP